MVTPTRRIRTDLELADDKYYQVLSSSYLNLSGVSFSYHREPENGHLSTRQVASIIYDEMQRRKIQ